MGHLCEPRRTKWNLIPLPAQDVRETFKRMAMNDEETENSTVRSYTFGKAHGA